MCILIGRISRTIDISIPAYKVVRDRKEEAPISKFDPPGGHPPGKYTGPYSWTKIKRGVWMKAKNQPQGGKTFIRRNPGFFVFPYKYDAQQDAASFGSSSYQVEKVFIKGACTFGKLDSHPCPSSISAEYICFLAEEGEDLSEGGTK